MLPLNTVTPTPTLWLAALLVTNLDKLFSPNEVKVHHCAPSGNVSVRDWGIFVLEGIREASAFVRDPLFDEERPKLSALGCSFAATPHWHELWKSYYKPEWFRPKPSPASPAIEEAHEGQA